MVASQGPRLRPADTSRTNEEHGEDRALPALNHRKKAEQLAFLLQLEHDLDRFSAEEEADRLLRHIHRNLGSLLRADYGFVFRLGRGHVVEADYTIHWTKAGERAQRTVKARALHDAAVRFARDRKSPEDPHMLLTLVALQGRPVGVLSFHRPARRFGRPDAHLAMDAAEILSRQLAHRERERTFEMREKIVRKVLLEHRPADILYQVLHGLKRLLRYDHSATVLTYDRAGSSLTVRAEIIAWKKGKSPRIGVKIPIGPEEVQRLLGLERCMTIASNRIPDDLSGELVRRINEVTEDAPEAGSLLLAGLRRNEELIGLLAIRDHAAGAFVRADEETIDSFLPVIGATALHAEFFRLQQNRLLEAERKTALGVLARAISHDLNNSFGVIQPLLETLRRDADAGTLTPEALKRDLAMLSQYIGTSLRIFRGLLSVSRAETESAHPTSLGSNIDAVLNLLDRGLRTAGIKVERRIEPDLPKITARPQDMDQLLLNLVTNAMESMPDGGTLAVGAFVEEHDGERAVHVTITDSGSGIKSRDLARVFEPFFTTKSGGTGLGLDICRSIVWEYDGALWLESTEGVGTTAHVRLPFARKQLPEPVAADGDSR